MDSSSDRSSRDEPPQRMSALYQYHNAPEVAPAHGLEYDDTIYPSSDKYPVIRENPLHFGKGKYGSSGDNRPPRIIFGMKVRTFLVVALVMALIVVGAAVGGAVGGKQLRQNQAKIYTANMNTPTPITTASPTLTPSHTTTFSAPTPTFSPLSDCAGSNNTEYTSQLQTTQGSSNAPPKHAGLKFTKYCNKQNPLSGSDSQRIVEAFVYTFNDCVELCAAYNYWNNGSNCTVAVYQPLHARPGNCWVGHTRTVQVKHLNETQGTDVAVLEA